MAQIDVERSQEFRKCIECFLCQDVCHVVRDHEENKTAYAGPRFFIRSAELEMHPLDTNDRRQLLQEEQGLGKCNITKCCTEVCPEHIKITDNAIIPLKERVVDAKYDPVAWLGRKIRNRSKRTAAEAAAEAPSSGPAAVLPPGGVARHPPAPTAPTPAIPVLAAAPGRHPADAPRRRPTTTPRSDHPSGEPSVPRFLTPEWVAGFNAALEGVVLPGARARCRPGRGRRPVHRGPGGPGHARRRRPPGAARRRRALPSRSARWTGRAAADDGDADVTIALDYEDAAALATGELSPAEALTGGRIRVRGDLSVLAAGQELLRRPGAHPGARRRHHLLRYTGPEESPWTS